MYLSPPNDLQFCTFLTVRRFLDPSCERIADIQLKFVTFIDLHGCGPRKFLSDLGLPWTWRLSSSVKLYCQITIDFNIACLKTLIFNDKTVKTLHYTSSNLCRNYWCIEEFVVNIMTQMKIVRIIGNIIFQIWLLTLKCPMVMLCSFRFLSRYFQFRCQYYSSIAPYQCSS